MSDVMRRANELIEQARRMKEDEAARLREQGLSWSELGEALGVQKAYARELALRGMSRVAS